MLKKLLPAAGLLLLFAAGCKKQDCNKPEPQAQTETEASGSNLARAASGISSETFETGTKTSYAAANVTLSTGSWNLDNTLIGNTTSDRKTGLASLRIQSTGMATMNFDVTNGASLVTIDHALYGTDPSATWQLWYSTNGGSTWMQTGSTITTSSTTLSTASFTLNLNGNVRFQIRKLTGTRLNIDNFSITDNAANVATRDNNLEMGNPSGAGTSSNNNYLLSKTQYALSYNNSKGMPNWVSWHLSTAWKGTATRCNCFTTDNSLPATFFKATTSHYTGTGFSRGHFCPSEDRDGSATDNAATFLMTNMGPQAPNLNAGPWNDLEMYCRTLITQGNELYIISGAYGQGGTGSNGGTTTTIASGSITVPARFWKVIVVLPIGTNDASRVSTATRVIAVNMPNLQTANNQTWGYYRTSVDAIESATGYDLLSAVSTAVQTTKEAQVDNGPTQ